MTLLAHTERPLRGVDQKVVFEEKVALESMVAHAIETATSSQGLGNNVAFAVVSVTDNELPALHPDETRLLNNRACSQKQAEWIAGRAAAHVALNELGAGDAAPIPRGDMGEPIWPNGFSGSITHCYPWSIAVAAKNSDQPIAIGIDLESSHRMRRADPHAIVDLICMEQEREWVQGGADFAERLTMIFAAKEALYKSLYPICRRYIDFKEVELAWRPYKSSFRAEFIPTAATDLAFLQEQEILCQQYEQLFLTCSIHGTA